MGRLALVLGALALFAGGSAAATLFSMRAEAAGPTTGTTGTSTTASVLTATNVSTAPSVVAFSGHGWGHGLGLSQWGAYGYALHGWTYDRILAHYYTGTSLGTAAVKTVRVLLASEKKVSLSSTVPWTLADAAGTKTTLDPGTLALGPKLVVDGAPAQAPLTLTAPQPLSVDGRAYRGRITLTTDGKSVDVVDTVALEAYLKGVVPAEMPTRWPPEALKTQAVAARSYALANLAKGRSFDLYGDTRSQVYGGVAAEAPSASAAVDATKGEIVLYNGKVADTLFFSTSGGRTASALESTGIAVPYLVPVSDPYDTLSPYHTWGPVLFDAAAVQKLLKLSAPVDTLAVTSGQSGRVKSLAVTSTDDAEVNVTGNQVRAVLGLRSTWFAPALFELSPATKSITYGGAVTLSGRVAGADGISLEAKPVGLDWTPAGAVTLDPDGGYSAIVKPQVTTWYRLAWGDARAGQARITVRARVSAVSSPPGVHGTLRPLAPGAPVQLQQKGPDGTWALLSATTADSASAWSFAGPLAAGRYRVRGVPGHGVAAGLSAVFSVQ